MDQTIINWLLTGFGGLIGFFLNVIWQSVKDLQTANRVLDGRIGEIEVLVAGSYTTKSDLNNIISAVFRKLDRIEDKLDGKADK